MGTRKNEHQGKSANGYFGSDGHGHCWGRGVGVEGGLGLRVGVSRLGIEHFGARADLGPTGIWDKWALRASGYWDKWAFGGKGTLRQRGVLGPMSIGTNKHLGKRAVWSKWANKQMVARGVGKCVEV